MTIKGASGPELIVRHTGQVFPLGTTGIRLGSQEDNTVVLADPRVSPHHAIIFWRAAASAYFVDDLGSDQGTYVNRIRVEAPRMLRHGDSIRLGDTVMDLKLPTSPSAAASTPPPANSEGSGASSMSPFWVGVLIAILSGATIVCMALFIVHQSED